MQDQQHRAADLERADSYRLCSVDLPWAWFTDLAYFDDLDSDDLAEPPRVGTTYISDSYELLKVAIDGPFVDRNIDTTPDEINTKEKAWFGTKASATGRLNVTAKTPLAEVVELVEEAGGNVYVPAERSEIKEIEP